jgi:RNA polymerase sigma-70 factor (ECF subfamily)
MMPMISASNIATNWSAAPTGESALPGVFHALQSGVGPERRAVARVTIDAAVRGQAISELDDIDALVRNYRPRLLRFVTFSIGDPDVAETIVQDTFLKAYKAREGFRGDASVHTYLTSIALNLIRDQQRTQKFRFWKQFRATAMDVTDVASFVAAGGSSPESQMLAKEKVARLYTVIETLSATQRMVFLMKFSDEMDVQEISDVMKMPVNTVKTHLHRALKAVRRQLGASQ